MSWWIIAIYICNIFVICHQIFQWIPEIEKFCRDELNDNIPILLVGLQTNKRSSGDSKDPGERVAGLFKQVTKYIECSEDKVGNNHAMAVYYYTNNDCD